MRQSSCNPVTEPEIQEERNLRCVEIAFHDGSDSAELESQAPEVVHWTSSVPSSAFHHSLTARSPPWLK